jgi:hypothetical protein
VNINIVYGPSVADAPSGFQGAVEAAAQFFDDAISTPITVTIVFGYGKVDGRPLDNSAIGESVANGSYYSYDQVRSALAANATSPDDLISTSVLPAADPTNGGTFFVTSALAKAVGLSVDDPSGIDGYVGLSSTAPLAYDPARRGFTGYYDAIGVLEHEISEVLGRVAGLGQPEGPNNQAGYAPLDLFRYDVPGHQSLIFNGANFSVDGQNLLTPFNNPRVSGDGGDWYTNGPADAFNADATLGAPLLVSSTDLRAMDVLGYTMSSSTLSSMTTDLSGVVALAQDPKSDTLYIATTSGFVFSWNELTHAFGPHAYLGVQLNALDVDATGSYLVAGENDHARYILDSLTELARIDRISLSDYSIQHFDYWSSADRITDISATSSGNILLTLPESTSSPLLSAGLQQGEIVASQIGNYSASYLIHSSDHRYTLVMLGGTDFAPLAVFDANTQQIVASANLYGPSEGGFNTGKADINDNSGLVVDLTGDKLVVYDLSLNVVKDLSSLQHNGEIIGVHFNRDGRVLFFWDQRLNKIEAYSTDTWQKLGDLALQAPSPLPSAYPFGDFGSMQVSNDGYFLIVDTGAGFATIDLRSSLPVGLVRNDTLTSAFTNVLRGAPTSPFAANPMILLADGSSVPNPMYQDAQALPGLASEVISGAVSLASALTTVEHWGDATTAVSGIAYQFFTGVTPRSAGYDYLVNSPDNPNNLNTAYYAKFSLENRFINFAVNLGKLGEGSAAFNAAYGSLTLSQAVTKAYTEIFGFAPAAGKIDAILNQSVQTGGTRADYFAFYGGDGLTGLGTKAAAVGWLMVEADKADLGPYVASDDNFLAALATGNPQYNINLLTTYPTMTAAQAAAMQAQAVLGASITNPLHVADLAANVVANLEALQAIAASSKLASIMLSDATTPTLHLTATLVSSDAAAIAAISSAYAIAVAGTSAQATGETIRHFSTAGSSLDLTDLNHGPPSFTANFAENAAATQGTLTLNDGTHAVSVTLIGQFAPAGFSGAATNVGFTFGADSASGTMIGWHG